MGVAYFVGCKMAEVIEETLGKDTLINCMPRSPVEFILTYNAATKKKGEEYVFSKKVIEILNRYAG